MTYVFISHDCYPFPIAKHLLDEGNEVLFGLVENLEDLGIDGLIDDETPEEKDERLANHDGIIDKMSVDDVLAILEDVEDKDKNDYFFFFDYNYLYPIAEQVLEMGFKSGLFVTEEDYKVEKDREEAKQFVKKNYPRIKIADYVSFNDVQDGIDYVTESKDVLCLKSNGNLGKTVVPKTDNLEQAKEQIINALVNYADEYEKGGFVLEKKIPNCLEVTPIMVFYDGKYVYSVVEFENKPYGAGNIGAQKGGSQSLNIRTEQNCEINKIAFPPAIYELAKKHIGLYIADCGLLYDGKDFWFTEYCGNRYGWDGFYSEAVMRDEGKPFITDYFDDIAAGRNPLKSKYGAALRLFNYEGDMEDTSDPVGDEPIKWDKSIDEHLFLYNVNEDGEEIVTTSNMDFVGCLTSGGNSAEEAVKGIYKMLDKFYFEKLYYRPMFDFLSKDYGSSIPNRIKAVEKFL
jgi:hypothetical protein